MLPENMLFGVTLHRPFGEHLREQQNSEPIQNPDKAIYTSHVSTHDQLFFRNGIGYTLPKGQQSHGLIKGLNG